MTFLQELLTTIIKKTEHGPRGSKWLQCCAWLNQGTKKEREKNMKNMLQRSYIQLEFSLNTANKGINLEKLCPGTAEKKQG